ncbi:uncharacterized protein LOC136028230 [Artemia franciscana]|uniref:Hyccin n=1 Tax=Artemia franciscana TaxID=6661 RepID=A0AA88HD37_ARTSF|nr:hypothetical protein QYM36_013903 [Artemia franciscana]
MTTSVKEFIDGIKEIIGLSIPSVLDQNSVQKIKIFLKADWDRYYDVICQLSEASGELEAKECVCQFLSLFYQSRDEELQRFCLQLTPNFTYIILDGYSRGTFRSLPWLKTLIASVYNFSISDEKAKPKTRSFRVLPLSHPSYYHEPIGLGPSPALTESTLRRLEPLTPKLVTWGPHEHIDALTMSNFPEVISVLLRLLNQQLNLITQKGLYSICTVIQRIYGQGFLSQASCEENFEPRLPFFSKISVEFLRTLYFASFNPSRSQGASELNRCATLALEALRSRALRDLNSDLIVMTTSVRHSIPRSRESGNVQPSVSNITNKTIITNASFRTKKHAEDIPIQDPEENKILGSISEEEEPMKRGNAIRSSTKEIMEKFKMPEINIVKRNREARKSESEGKKGEIKEVKRDHENKPKRTDTNKKIFRSDTDEYELQERRKENVEKSGKRSGDYSFLVNGTGL